MLTVGNPPNEVEAWKREKHGFDVWNDLEAYARAGTPMADIDAADLQRLKWYGIFPARRPAADRYMIRIRVPACELTSPQARAAADVARMGSGLAEITRRGDVQVRGLRIRDLPAVAARLEAEGLTGRQTGHDNVRNVMTHPLAGLDPAELLDARPLCRALTDVFLGDRLLSDLPRRVTVAVDGRESPSPYCWAQCTSFVAARSPDGTPGYHWLIAVARDPDSLSPPGAGRARCRAVPLWLGEDQVPEVFRHALHLYRELACRSDRSRCRLRDLVAHLGVPEFTRLVESRLGSPLTRLPEAPEPAPGPSCRLADWSPQKQPGTWSLGIPLPPDRLTPALLTGLADLSESFGDGTLRTAHGPGLVVPSIPSHRKGPALLALARLRPSPVPVKSEPRFLRPDGPLPSHLPNLSGRSLVPAFPRTYDPS